MLRAVSDYGSLDGSIKHSEREKLIKRTKDQIQKQAELVKKYTADRSTHLLNLNTAGLRLETTQEKLLLEKEVVRVSRLLAIAESNRAIMEHARDVLQLKISVDIFRQKQREELAKVDSYRVADGFSGFLGRFVTSQSSTAGLVDEVLAHLSPASVAPAIGAGSRSRSVSPENLTRSLLSK